MDDLESQPLSSFRDLFASVRVREEDSLERVVTSVLDHPGFHDLCVVDDEDRLLGVINIKKLFRTVFFHHADRNLMTRHQMELASSETAGHLMVTRPLVARHTDELGTAIRTMVQHDLGELPVVDQDSRLVGSVSMSLVFELWRERQREGG